MKNDTAPLGLGRRSACGGAGLLNTCRTIKHLTAMAVGLSLLAAISATATPVTVEELSVSPYQVVSITTSTLGTFSAQAGTINLLVNGVATPGFCIDPFHFSVSGPQNYNTQTLSDGPKAPGGPMGTAAATKIEQLWTHYFSPNMSATDAAGLQIAIWEIVGGSGFTLHQENDYGASAMLDWWSLNQNTAPTDDLIALTGPGQDYMIPNSKPPASVPEGGTTAALLGGALCGLITLRRKL
jgi:hypothetical protein